MEHNRRNSDSEAGERDRTERDADGNAEKQQTSRHGNNESADQPHNPTLARGNTTESVNKWVKKRLDEHENLPSQSVSWWHPHLAKLRKHTSMLWIRNTFIICAATFVVLCLYWGIVFRIEENLPSLVCYVVDFDGQVEPYRNVTPLIGPTVTNLANKTLWSAIPSIGYQIRTPSEFNFDPLQVRQAVYHFRAWSAIIVNPNATALLQEAVAMGNSSYDPTGAVQVITLSGRDSFMTFNYILPKLTIFTQELTSLFGKAWGEAIMANESLSKETLQRAASAVNPAISPLMLDLRPFGPPAAIPAVTFGLSFLIATFGFTYYLADDQKCIIPEGHPPVHYWHHVIRRWFALMAAYFFLSLVYCLMSLAFQVPFSNPPASPVEVAQNPNAFGKASFPVFWMLHFLGMAALGMACENMAMVIGGRWVGLWLTFWVLTNTLTGFWPPDIAPGFYRWAYAWPYHHVVEGARQILFDLHSRIGLNFGVLTAWVVVNTVVFVPACYFMRWKDERQIRKEETRLPHFSLKRFDVEKQIPKPPGAKPPRRKRGFLRAM
ncbi:mnng and nitrosoguanidine resistance protein [Colletotrichum sojae]|uniref:Mnng and nitrosoguanidine resistance protein n=1 Tax=Colletotrichum sojae TaxID=2175907 RepID=A0A8H6IMH7_9PEZI|nr:mnng and nitrosoguanidine resistance protein [Colletotrichum sojae]